MLEITPKYEADESLEQHLIHYSSPILKYQHYTTSSLSAHFGGAYILFS